VKVLFLDDGRTDYLWWQANVRKVLKRINQLIADIDRNGHEGIHVLACRFHYTRP